MEDQWLLSAIYDDDLVEKLKVRSSTSSRSTSINVPSLENEFLSSSSGSRVSDDLYLHPIEENREPFKLIGKPLPSTTGRFLSLLANHFQITCNGSIIHQYYIRFDPDIPSKKLNRTILRTLQEQNPGLIECPLVFDGIHTVYSTELINVKEVNNSVINVAGVVNTKESPNLFKLYLTHVDSFLLDTKIITGNQDQNQKLRMMHAIDTVFRQTSTGNFHAVLQSFFSIAQNSAIEPSHGLGWGTVNLGVGREVCYGFYQNVVETFDTLTMNLDVATTTFYRPVALVEFLAEILEVPLATVTDGRSLSDVQKKKFNREVAGLKVETRHCSCPRRFRVARCTWKPTENISFHLSETAGNQDSKPLSLVEYYKRRYNIDLTYKHLPCIEVGRTRECILPLELCYVVSGQRCIKKLNEQQIANLIRATSRNATERQNAVMSLQNRLKMDNDVNAVKFGLKVEAQLLKIEGRVLPVPRLLYRSPNLKRQECVTVPNNGTWDMRGKNFYSGIQIREWAIVCFASPEIIGEASMRSFVRNLVNVASEIGMPFLEEHRFCRYAEPDQTVKLLEHLNEQYNLQLVLCIVPGKSVVYGELKRKGELLGLTTQCVRSQNVSKASPHTLSNLCMKINSKLGGINVILSSPPQSLNSEPVLFIGCHLTRSSLASSSDSTSSIAHCDSSIACLVGSMDGHPTQFSPIFRTQPRHQRTIVDMCEMTREAIINFRKSTGFKPHKIIIYRAGIADVTVDEIMQTELRAVRDACAMIEYGFQPGITFIGLDVTHHTRLFAANEKDRVGNSQNVPAGTLVETGITVNNLFEFYLVSHAGIQGTSRPTKYVVMWDDNSIPSADIHEMTYQLCHTQSRCTRSVSIPSPVYYAKLVAQRAKILMADENFDMERFRLCGIGRNDGMSFT
ncbi:Protein argonaute-2 [Caenorhabditis elegans]|uniref:Protein argonaute-2 n=1 Tax=Caenorhabditis elegans TaxID=6239 RepID=Q9XVI3_CAEEL|nr:Protein argonaute-2 [Caenorhabditis elegans]CAB03400.2 Protein argonaute-2 [Caenorhabditis elegans]|eukprot:NP_492643.2 Protein argonaute [Caenorhabditis elegans]